MVLLLLRCGKEGFGGSWKRSRMFSTGNKYVYAIGTRTLFSFWIFCPCVVVGLLLLPPQPQRQWRQYSNAQLIV